jgi:hypothetical protein
LEVPGEGARRRPLPSLLSLLERLVHRARVSVSGRRDTWEADLAAMASDPKMRRELSRINAEFGATEADGLVGD